MKTFTTALAAAYASRSTTMAQCLRIERRDGAVYRFTSHDADLTVAGEVYSAGPGLDFSGSVTSAGLAPDNMELRILYDSAAITREDLLGGRWDGAKFRLFEVDWQAPDAGSNVLLRGRTGEASATRGEGFTIELRSLKQALQRAIGTATQKTCRRRFGDSRCRVDAAAFTFAGVVETVYPSRARFRAINMFKDAGYFNEGEVRMTSGANVGLARRVKIYAADDTFDLVAPFPFALAAGDTFQAVAGCLKRVEDCINFGNVLNFDGEPDLQGIDALTKVPAPGAGG